MSDKATVRSNMCLHCLEEGEWVDEDRCPACEVSGHTSPWQVGRCEACNKKFFDAITRIQRDIDARKDLNGAVADLQARVRALEDGRSHETR